jgi:hypothetical protein
MTSRILHHSVFSLICKSLEVNKGRSSRIADYAGHCVKNARFANNVLDLNFQNGCRDFPFIAGDDIGWGLDKIDMAQEYVAASKTDPSILAVQGPRLSPNGHLRYSPTLSSACFRIYDQFDF